MIKLYVLAGIFATLLAGVYFEHLEASHAESALAAYQEGQRIYHDYHLQSLREAHQGKLTDTAAVAAAHSDQPLEPVRLCVRPTSVPRPRTASAGSSPPSDVAGGVHEGDSAVRQGAAGPDISDLLDAFAALFAAKNIDLREQQSVK